MQMDTPTRSYLSPKLEGREINNKGGRGVFTLASIGKGEVLAVWGGDVYTHNELDLLPLDQTHLGLQIDDDFYLIPRETCPADWVNHSCNPNAGIRGQITLVALRDISTGEEICFDYAMTDSSAYDEFICECGTPNCRQRITGNDWRIPSLWQLYEGYFAEYLWRRIKIEMRKL